MLRAEVSDSLMGDIEVVKLAHLTAQQRVVNWAYSLVLMMVAYQVEKSVAPKVV